MVGRVFLVALFLESAVLVACNSFGGSDSTPSDASTTDPGADSGGPEPGLDGSVTTDDASAASDGGANAPDASDSGVPPAKGYFTTVVYPAVRPTCDKCHQNGSAASAEGWFESTASATYNDFKTKRFDQAPAASNPFLTKGMHSGPALDTTTQVPYVINWIKLENDGGS